MRGLGCAVLLATLGWSSALAKGAEPARSELILHNAVVWTGDPARPAAQAVAVAGSRILKVGTNSEVLATRALTTRVLDLRGGMLVPGFIDAHTHFEVATDWFFEVRLADVDDEAELLVRLRETAARTPPEFWITGTDWGGLTARRRFNAGERAYAAFEPNLARIDAIVADRPVLFTRHDGAVFANSEALRRLRLTKGSPSPSGGEIKRDPATGLPTGMLLGTSAAHAVLSMPPKSMARTLAAAKGLIAQLHSHGITGIHDIARLDALSQSTVFRTFVERGHSNESIFRLLRESGHLNLRVYPILTLRTFEGLAAQGVRPGKGDEWIRYGALKAFIDGYLTFQPWASRPTYSGDFTMRVVDEATMEADVVGADRLGFDIAVHAYADKAHWLMLKWFEKAIAANGPRDRRFRLIHAYSPTLEDIKRAGRLGAVADITPIDPVESGASTETMLGPERAKTAFAWRTMIDSGMRLNIVSDIPGYFDKSAALPADPLINMYYATTRRAIGAPAGKAWHPEQALTIEEALKAYTVNPAWSSREDAIKGSISEGKLADLVVLSRDILAGPPEMLLETRVLHTFLGGKSVYEAAVPRKER